ncbi:retrovirus-related pol polyprotein from transposon TNT 1-94 [Tanacetum coccineum]
MDRQCTKPKRPKSSAWFKEKAMLAKALELGMVLDEEQMAFLADNGDTLYAYASDVLSEVPTHDNYLETKNPVVQSTNSSAQQDAPLMSMIKEMSHQVAKCTEVLVDISAKVVNFENQIHLLKLQLSATVKSHKTLSTTVDALKKVSKIKEDKYMDQIIESEKKKKALDNVVYKMGKYLCCTVATIVKPHDVLSVIDTKETLELAEESRLKMLEVLNDFENVVTVRTKVAGQNEGSRGFEHIQKAFDKDVKLFVKTLKEYFHMFDQGLHKEITNMKDVFTQMGTKVAKCFVEIRTYEIKEKGMLIENDCLLEHIICQDVMSVVMHANVEMHYLVHNAANSLAEIINYQNKEKSYLDEYAECVQLKAEISKKNDMDAPEFPAFFEINELKAQIDLDPLSPKLLRNREAYVDYLKHTQETADTLREIVEHARELRPLDSDLDSTCKFVTRIQELLVYHVVLNANSELICATCNECMFDAIHDLCVLDYVNNVNVRVESKSVNSKKKKIWKPTGKIFTSVSYSWKPTGRTFTIDGNACPLTRIASTKVVPPKKPISTTIVKKTLPSSTNSGTFKDTTNVVQIILWYLDSSCSKHMTGQRSQLINIVSKFMGTVRFENDHVVVIKGYGDYQIENVMISQAEAVATACYTQNCSLIQRRHNKTLYELIHGIKPDLTYFHVFGALCYPTNDGEDPVKLNPKADIGIFIGYALAKKAY